MKRFLLSVILATTVAIAAGCGGGGGQSIAPPNQSPTAPVTLKFSLASNTMRSASATRAPISAIKNIKISITGPLMTDINDTIEFTGLETTVSKTYQVPIGPQRKFYVEASAEDGKVLYKGVKVQAIVAGQNSVSIDLYTTEEFARIEMDVEVPNVPQTLAPIYGACMGFYGSDGNPNNGTLISSERVTDWLTKLKPYMTAVRFYSCRNGMDAACKIAKNMGYMVWAQAWIGTDTAINQQEIEASIAVAQARDCDVIILGSEALLRGDIPAGTADSPAGFDTLIGCMKYVQERVDCPVTYDDIGAQLIANPDVINQCEDVVLANIYPYWEGSSIETSLESFITSYNNIKAVCGNKELVVGETGWPTDGNMVGAAAPNEDNAQYYFTQVTSWAKSNGIRVLWFEGTDELWKALNEGPQGAHWGLFDTECNMKPAFRWYLY